MTTTRPEQSIAESTDPVDTALQALAAPRWSREPDWRTFQEKLMQTRTFGWRHFALLALLASGCFAAGAAWDRFAFTGTMKLNDGGNAAVSGELIRGEGDSFMAELKSDKDLSSGGTLEMTMPDGRKATLVTAVAGDDCKPGQTREITLPDGKKIKVPVPARSAACLKACGAEKCTGACMKR